MHPRTPRPRSIDAGSRHRLGAQVAAHAWVAAMDGWRRVRLRVSRAADAKAAS